MKPRPAPSRNPLRVSTAFTAKGNEARSNLVARFGAELVSTAFTAKGNEALEEKLYHYQIQGFNSLHG